MKLSIYFSLFFILFITACQTEKEPKFSDFIGDWYCAHYFDEDGSRLKYPLYGEITFWKDSSLKICHHEVGRVRPYYKSDYQSINFNKIGDSVNIEIIWNDTMSFDYGFYHKMPEHYTYTMSVLNTDTTEQGKKRFRHLINAAETIRMNFKGQPATYKEIQSILNLDVLKEEGIYEEYDQLFKDYSSDF